MTFEIESNRQSEKQREVVVKVEDLEFNYPGKKEETLKGLNFNINKGEIFGFLGPSGAGKSTTQKIITGILKNFQGRVELLGIDITKISNDFYEKIGVSFELPNLYERFTALENLNYFASLYRSKTKAPLKLLKMVGLADQADRRVRDFSKGMKMRLNLCRAFLNNPQVLFLDEPTSGLDPGNARRVKEIILKQCRQGKTVFLTTHDMKAVEDLCDRAAFIVDGKIVLIDFPQNLKRKYGSSRVDVEYSNPGRNTKTKKEVFSLRGLGQNQKFWQLLQENEIEAIHSQEADLEEVFIKVTGRSLQ